LSMREAVLPPKVQRLRQKLSCKAKEQKRYRFYSLYDKIIDKETLTEAYRKARANGGAPGTDGVSFDRIDEVIGERFCGRTPWGAHRWAIQGLSGTESVHPESQRKTAPAWDTCDLL